MGLGGCADCRGATEGGRVLSLVTIRYLALGGAAVALLGGVVLFFAPFGVSQDLAGRGTAAAALVSGFAIVLGALALVANVQVQTSDFRAVQRVNEDTLRLMASLRSISLKAVWLTQQATQLDARHASLFDGERQVIQEFLTSTTAKAFYRHEARMSAMSENRGEEWRVFWLYLIGILRDEMPTDYRSIAHSAVRAEDLLRGLRSEDITALIADVADLQRAIQTFGIERSTSIFTRAAHDVFGGEQEVSVDLALEQLRVLKSQGIEDPDLDLFLAVDQGSTGDVQSALEAGAHPNITVGELLNRYRDRLETPSRPE